MIVWRFARLADPLKVRPAQVVFGASALALHTGNQANIGIMENKMETTIMGYIGVILGYIGIMENKIETTILYTTQKSSTPGLTHREPFKPRNFQSRNPHFPDISGLHPEAHDGLRLGSFLHNHRDLVSFPGFSLRALRSLCTTAW